MAINFNHKLENGILKVCTFGFDESLEDTENYAQSVFNLSIELNCDRVICDERELEYSLSVIDTFELAEYASNAARGLIKVAIVCQKKYLEDGKFFETVSSNRGLTVLVSSDIDQANEWLLT